MNQLTTKKENTSIREKRLLNFKLNCCLLRSNCKSTVAIGISNLTAHDVITKWIPFSLYHLFPPLRQHLKHSTADKYLRIVSFHFILCTVSHTHTLPCKFTNLLGNKRKLIPWGIPVYVIHIWGKKKEILATEKIHR